MVERAAGEHASGIGVPLATSPASSFPRAMSGSTAATLMLTEGWDMKVVAQLLGHASVTTTSRYLDELPGELSVAVNAHP